MARIDEWEPKQAPRRQWLRLVGILLIIAMFMGAAIADIFRPLPPITVSQHHPHTVTWADPGGGVE